MKTPDDSSSKRPVDDMVTAKETKKRRDRMSFGVLPVKLPVELYDFTVAAVKLRRRLKEENLENPELIECVLSAEEGIRVYSNVFKNWDLPRKWEYDPDIAATLVDNGSLVRLEYKDTKAYARWITPRRVPKTSGVPLSEEEKVIWQRFIESDKDTPALRSINLDDQRMKQSKSIELDDPMVDLIGNFAVNTYNEAYRMVVNEKVEKRIKCIEYLKLSYIKMKRYYFYLMMTALEKGKKGLYEIKVVFEDPYGDCCSRRLSRFHLIGPAPLPPEIAMAEIWLSSSSSIPLPRLEEGSSSDEDEDDTGCVGGSDTGMFQREKGASCTGYDFVTPHGLEGFDGP
ncbi:uncharacterized protein [Rutidosis leptorrhynchoides]|uniref:uncharacterized protein n=1 Tax=Rutidosis leptorrhynchoides TaxID=125765 RepID=UPI003A9A42B9